MVGFGEKTFKSAFKCIKDTCPKGAKPEKKLGWKKLRLAADIKSKSAFKPVACYPFKEEIPYNPNDLVTIGGYVFKCKAAKAEECPYVDPKDPDGGSDIWEATGQRGTEKALPK